VTKIEESIQILKSLGFEKSQQNERSGLVLLSLIQLEEEGKWSVLRTPLMGVRNIMDFCRNTYQKPYAENSRESFRKETLHQFVDQGFVLQNPDNPSRSPNSPKWVYQMSPEGKHLLESFGKKEWENRLSEYLKIWPTLIQKNRMVREMVLTPTLLPSGEIISLSMGGHSELIRDIIQEFGRRFVPECQVLYVGDTGDKSVVFEKETLEKLGVVLHERGKLPDVILYSTSRNWLFLIESVTSVGPVDGKRYRELTTLFGKSKCGLVFVTVFPDKTLLSRFVSQISWETEVWVRDNPDHLIHFNGDKFLGPYTSRSDT
jgi:adenine-specific DNA-methyltransferase